MVTIFGCNICIPYYLMYTYVLVFNYLLGKKKGRVVFIQYNTLLLIHDDIFVTLKRFYMINFLHIVIKFCVKV